MSAMGNLTEFECGELKESFALFDKDKGGTIEPSEFQEVLASLGCTATTDEIAELVGIAEAGAAGRVTFPDFLAQFQHIENEDLDNESFEAWKLLSEGGEEITGKNIQNFMDKFNLKLSPEEIKAILEYGDKDGDGKFGKDDFTQFYLDTGKSE